MMADFSMSDILDAYKKELGSPKLSELSEGFYQGVGKLVSRLLFEIKRGDELQRELLQEELNNVVFLVQEIHTARVLKAMEEVSGGETPTSILERERQAFSDVRQELEKLGEELVSPALSGKVEVSAPFQKTRVAVLMLSEQPEKIIGPDLQSYGPFEKGEIVSLPEPSADMMVRRGQARRVGVKA